MLNIVLHILSNENTNLECKDVTGPEDKTEGITLELDTANLEAYQFEWETQFFPSVV